ncbi:hypothetical protein Y032_0255g321 [Ancylostoma ceylanicum]|uniref:Uncharacterized protein n=1 Tax=Ancylostoma ceylanicum TaxID=53326 RepID=A0A016SC76_9BILA|nr:hypothetical protein Y032_0255g321 [Ancylostoma ceylanicum]
MVEDINEDYTRLLGTIIKIRNVSRAEAPNRSSRRISSSTRAHLAKRRHMDRQANQQNQQRLTEDQANFVRSRLLDAAHRKRSLKMEKRALAKYLLSIPSSKAPDGTDCSSRPGTSNFLHSSSLGQTTTGSSPGKEFLPFLMSEVRHTIETMPRGKALGTDGIIVEHLQACDTTLYTARARRFPLSGGM